MKFDVIKSLIFCKSLLQSELDCDAIGLSNKKDFVETAKIVINSINSLIEDLTKNDNKAEAQDFVTDLR